MTFEEQAVQTAKSLGHAVEADHPWGMTLVRRWTCKACGDAVLVNGNVIYGSASTDPCWETKEPLDRADPPAPLLDPDCRDDKHGSCVGGPCECECHQTGGDR